MWLLSTDRSELHYFARNFDATGGYAILSHTWEGDEQTFQEVRAIGERCRASGTNPRDDPALSPKIRNFCTLAEKHGYHWVWVDSCCIDKTSSSELSEAINSMYQWYKEAEVCYAYLVDVPGDCILHSPSSAFRTSRWHTRGWTLQELIAPDFLIFLSADWHELGNRALLAELLWEVTGIPSEVLTGQMRPALYSACVRMSWASGRKTTRVEDEAYCLMGLFRVNMPTNYGEGKRAFIRLQSEIMQLSSDMSLFAFGSRVRQDRDIVFHPQEIPSNRWKYLMADSPRQFGFKVDDIPKLGMNAKQRYPPAHDSIVTGPFDDIELPRAAMTSYGVKLRLPVYEAEGITIAVILCVGARSGSQFGLFLTRDKTGKDPKRPRYFITCVYSKASIDSGRYVARMADLGDDLYNLTFNGKPVRASWRTIYVVPTESDFDSGSTTTPSLILNCNPHFPFRVPRWLISRLIAMRFEVEQVRNEEALQIVGILHRFLAVNVHICIGSCTEPHNRYPTKSPVLWINVCISSGSITMDKFTHDCSEDHIDSKSWEMRSRLFGEADQKVQLSFMPSTRMSEDVFVIHLELCGRVFEEAQRDAAISLPLLADLEKDRIRSMVSNAPGIVASFRPGTHRWIESSSPRIPSSTFTNTSHTQPSRIPRLALPYRLDTHGHAGPQDSHDTPHTPDPCRGSPNHNKSVHLLPTSPPASASPRLRAAALGERGTIKRGAPQ